MSVNIIVVKIVQNEVASRSEWQQLKHCDYLSSCPHWKGVKGLQQHQVPQL